MLFVASKFQFKQLQGLQFHGFQHKSSLETIDHWNFNTKKNTHGISGGISHGNGIQHRRPKHSPSCVARTWQTSQKKVILMLLNWTVDECRGIITCYKHLYYLTIQKNWWYIYTLLLSQKKKNWWYIDSLTIQYTRFITIGYYPIYWWHMVITGW